MFEILPVNDKNILAFKATGKLTDADYKQFLPVLESMIETSGQISLYIELRDFDGWEMDAAWDDFNFGVHHDNDFKRIAIVGDNSLIHAATGVINLFTHMDMRFFDDSESESAWNWLRETSVVTEPEKPVQPYKNILLPTDFSSYSNVAATRALQLVEQTGAKLHVLHAIEKVMYYGEAYDPIIAEISYPDDDDLLAQAQAQMTSFCERNDLGKSAIIETRWGNPKWSVINWANENNIDLIVMGSHGQSGFERLLGSVSNSVLHKAHCDVLIVKS